MEARCNLRLLGSLNGTSGDRNRKGLLLAGITQYKYALGIQGESLQVHIGVLAEANRPNEHE